MVIVLMGKSAVGKDTILNELVSEFNFERVVSATNRVPREGETNGKDYHFVTAEQFDKMIEDNEFVEHVRFNGVKYGCPKSSIDVDKDMCIVLETNGAEAFINEFGRENIFTVYLMLDDKRRYERATGRSDISFEDWQKREESDNERFKAETISELANFVICTNDDPCALADVILDAFEAYKECPALKTGEKCIVEEVRDEYGYYDSCKAYSQTEVNNRIQADKLYFEEVLKDIDYEAAMKALEDFEDVEIE